MAYSSMEAKLGGCRQLVEAAIEQMQDSAVAARVWAKDYTLWKPSPEEISNRLGWLKSPSEMLLKLHEMQSFADEVRTAGYTRVLLLGMGGSSLAPEVFRRTFGAAQGFLDLAVLDSTDPAAVLSMAEKCDPAKTLFIVSTKSGGTVETLSFFKYFYTRTVQTLGEENAGAHFAAITVEKSPLAVIARERRFRKTFFNDPEIGGRYSALSFFGLVPAALIGMDLHRLLNRARDAAEEEKAAANSSSAGMGLYLGAIMGSLAKAGRDKATFLFSDPVSSFGAWLEQLIAESLGKEGRGILPVVGEPAAAPGVYSGDRFFIDLRLKGRDYDQAARSALYEAGHPLVTFELQDVYDLGAQCFIWEMASAVAGHLLKVNPFDQPDVESAKSVARAMIADYEKSGRLPAGAPLLSQDGIDILGELPAAKLDDVFQAFLKDAEPDSYIALQAFLQPTPETDNVLQKLRLKLRDKFKLAVTVGYGPRYLHSTGQLHKGDSGKGMFIQFSADDATDCPIPDEAGKPASSLTFGILKTAQVIGDGKALANAGRRVIRLHLPADVIHSIELLAGFLDK